MSSGIMIRLTTCCFSFLKIIYSNFGTLLLYNTLTFDVDW